MRTATARARAAGALAPLETRAVDLEERGIRFRVQVAPSLARKPSATDFARGPRRDPFLPFDGNLFVCDLRPDRVCLLNKFPVLRDHLLVATRGFAEQEAPLDPGDFEALWTLLLAEDGLAVYNAGPAAGASQPHRHAHFVPTPLGAGPRRTPIDPVLDTVRFDAEVGRSDALPFHHAVARLRECEGQPPPVAAQALHGLYREMARAFGCDRAGVPYNLLVTREWMLLVPRSREHWEGVSVNGLGFAGALLVPSEAALERVRAAGPLAVLTHVGVRIRPGG